MPCPSPARSPAQIEASRRNGARSRGPVTSEGKERASRNALKHGLTALHHLVLEDEVPDALEALIATVAEETGAATEIEARLARRLAIALWKGERAERIETALFDAAPKLRPPQAGFEWEEADPLTTFDLRRFNAVRGYQAQQGREISRCLKELRLLRKDALVACTDEPEGASENEPKGHPAPANDDLSATHASRGSPGEEPLRNEPRTGVDPALMPVGRAREPGREARYSSGHSQEEAAHVEPSAARAAGRPQHQGSWRRR
jgi:hypothetical protein